MRSLNRCRAFAFLIAFVSISYVFWLLLRRLAHEAHGLGCGFMVGVFSFLTHNSQRRRLTDVSSWQEWLIHQPDDFGPQTATERDPTPDDTPLDAVASPTSVSARIGKSFNDQTATAASYCSTLVTTEDSCDSPNKDLGAIPGRPSTPFKVHADAASVCNSRLEECSPMLSVHLKPCVGKSLGALSLSHMTAALPHGTGVARVSPAAPLHPGCPCLPKYRPLIRRTYTFSKIHGCHPTQITPGHEARLALLVAELDGSGSRRLGSVYVRPGCVELLLEEEVWGSDERLDEASPCPATSGLGGAATAADTLHLLDADLAAEGLRPTSSNFSWCSLSAHDPRQPPVSTGATLDQPMEHWADSAAGGCVVAAAAGSRHSHVGLDERLPVGSSVAVDDGDSDTDPSSGIDLAAIICALQLRDDRSVGSSSVTACMSGAEGESLCAGSPAGGDNADWLAEWAQDEEGVAAAANKGPVADDQEHPPSRMASNRSIHAIPVQEHPVRLSQILLGPSEENRGAVTVARFEPRVLLLTPSHVANAHHPAPAAAIATAGPSGRDVQAQGPVPSSGTSAADGAGGSNSSAATTPPLMRAVIACAAALPSYDAPTPLEVLVCCQSRYLRIETRWRPYVGEPTAGPRGGEADTAGSRWGRSSPYPDAAAEVDVNRPRMLELSLLEQPSCPGLALVDFRWSGRPCRVVPLVLTADPAVALELQAAVSTWSCSQAELDELLLDFGTWEFHAARGLGVGAGAIDVRRMSDLTYHLLRYVEVCGWVHTAAHIRDWLECWIGSRVAGAVAARRAEQAASLASSSSRAQVTCGRGVQDGGLAAGGEDPAMALCASESAGKLPGSVNVEREGVGGGLVGATACSQRCKPLAGPAYDALMMAVGLRRASLAEEEAFRAFAGPWICAQSQGLLFIDLLCFLALLYRAHKDILQPCNVTTLVACQGALLFLARPFLTRHKWAGLVRAYRLPRFAAYATAKALIVFFGFPPPPGISSYATGSSILIMEGIIVPGASLLPLTIAAPVLLLLSTMTGLMLRVCGANFGVEVGMGTYLLGMVTTTACHAYMRACFLRHGADNGRSAMTGSKKTK